jgi:hypothetical protein
VASLTATVVLRSAPVVGAAIPVTAQDCLNGYCFGVLDATGSVVGT